MLQPMIQNEPTVMIVGRDTHRVARSGQSGTKSAQGQHVPKGAEGHDADLHQVRLYFSAILDEGFPRFPRVAVSGSGAL